MCASVNHSLWSTLQPEMSLRKLQVHCYTTTHFKSSLVWNTGVLKSPWKMWCYLNKHLANGWASFVGSTVHWHGLSVSGELQSELLFHQLFDDLRHRKKESNKLLRDESCHYIKHRKPIWKLMWASTTTWPTRGCNQLIICGWKCINIPSCTRSLSQPWKGPSVVCRTHSFSPPDMLEQSLWLLPPSRTHLWPDIERNSLELLFDN